MLLWRVESQESLAGWSTETSTLPSFPPLCTLTETVTHSSRNDQIGGSIWERERERECVFVCSCTSSSSWGPVLDLENEDIFWSSLLQRDVSMRALTSTEEQTHVCVYRPQISQRWCSWRGWVRLQEQTDSDPSSSQSPPYTSPAGRRRHECVCVCLCVCVMWLYIACKLNFCCTSAPSPEECCASCFAEFLVFKLSVESSCGAVCSINKELKKKHFSCVTSKTFKSCTNISYGSQSIHTMKKCKNMKNKVTKNEKWLKPHLKWI